MAREAEDVENEPYSFVRQLEVASDLGYGADVHQMNLDHDVLHEALCAWLGVPCLSVTDVKDPKAVAEEKAVRAVQRLMRMHGVSVPKRGS